MTSFPDEVPSERTRTDKYVRIARHQTAKLWIIPRLGDPKLHVVSLHCPTCRDPENSRLVHVVLETDGSDVSDRPAAVHPKPNVAVLVRVTRLQIEEILASFGNHYNGSTLIDAWAAPEGSH